MRNVPVIDVALHASPIAGVGVGIAALATLVLMLALPAPPALHALGGAGVLAWAWESFRTIAMRTGSRSVAALHLGGDRLLAVRYRDGRLVAGHVRSASYVSSALTAIVWRPDGARFSRAVLVLPDMLPPDHFRRLRILLRYARSGVAHDAPASQA